MSSPSDKNVLVMGIKTGPADLSHEQALAVFRDQIEAAKKGGIRMHVHQVDISLSHDVTINEVCDVLKKERWDGVAIGFGLRGREDLTPLFEQLVNAVAENVHPAPKFAFPLRPHLVWEAVARVYSIEQ